MKHTLFILSFLTLFIVNNCNAQEVVYEDQAIGYVVDWLPAGKYRFEILRRDVPPSLAEICRTYEDAIRKNDAWHQRYIYKYRNEDEIPYHENFVITEAEYKKMLEEYPKCKMITSLTKPLNISYENEKLKFQGVGNFKLLDIIELNNKDYNVMIDTMDTDFVGVVHEDSTVYGSYSGYNWEFEKGDREAVKELKKSDYSNVKLSFVRTIPDGKNLMFLEVFIVENLKTIVNSKVSGYLTKIE